jgi:hypothetical protein
MTHKDAPAAKRRCQPRQAGVRSIWGLWPTSARWVLPQARAAAGGGPLPLDTQVLCTEMVDNHTEAWTLQVGAGALALGTRHSGTARVPASPGLPLFGGGGGGSGCRHQRGPCLPLPRQPLGAQQR